MKMYISGQIDGLKLDDAKKRFKDAEIEVEKLGYDPVNPFNNGLSEMASYEEHLAADLTMLYKCDAIYLLRGWENSRGARIEKEFAKYNEKLIFKQ